MLEMETHLQMLENGRGACDLLVFPREHRVVALCNITLAADSKAGGMKRTYKACSPARLPSKVCAELRAHASPP